MRDRETGESLVRDRVPAATNPRTIASVIFTTTLQLLELDGGVNN